MINEFYVGLVIEAQPMSHGFYHGRAEEQLKISHIRWGQPRELVMLVICMQETDPGREAPEATSYVTHMNEDARSSPGRKAPKATSYVTYMDAKTRPNPGRKAPEATSYVTHML
jgi:hypothetical protein